MISFGFTMVKVFQFLEASQKAPVVGFFGRTWSPEAVGLTMLTIGIVSLIFAILQHWSGLKSMRAEGLEPKWSLALVVATLVALLGVFAMVTIVLGK